MNATRTKYNVEKDKAKRTHNGIVFDSILEMKFYRDWILPRMESGDILKCELQVNYELQQKFNHNEKAVRPINYVADFVITDKNNHLTVIDTKGMPDGVALLKRKMFWYKYPDVDYRWIGFSKIDGGWVDYDLIKKGRQARKKAQRTAAN